MKKRNVLKNVAKSIVLCAGLLGASIANAQLKQYYIGTAARSEIAVAVRATPDGSTVIAGYSYDNATGGVVNNADMLLVKVRNGAIIWQKSWGTVNDDMIQDMIIAQNGDIIVVGTVGRTAPAAGNTAAIYRFNEGGVLMGQNYVRDNSPVDYGGEVFFGVCELANGNIVAVGNRDNRPDYGDALVSTFTPSLGLIYSDVFMADKSVNGISDLFAGATPNPANPNEVYLAGYKFHAGSSTHDARLALYKPPVAAGSPGILVWDNRYDFNYHGLTNNIFSKIHSVSGNQFVIEGWISTDCCAADNLKQIIARTDLTGTSCDVRVLLNNRTYANSFSYFPVSYDKAYVVETPNNTPADPTYTGSTTVLNGVVSDISSLSAPLVSYSKSFGLPGYHSLIDITDGNNTLYMAGGATSDPAGFGGTDIYYVESDLAVTPGIDQNACKLTNDTLGIDSIVTTAVAMIDSQYAIVPATVNPLGITDAAMSMELVCGTQSAGSGCNFSPTTLTIQYDYTDKSGNCVYTATANASTTSTIVGYQWTVTGQSTVVDHTSASSDNFTFTVPPGQSITVSVVVDAINMDYPAGTSPCCESDPVSETFTSCDGPVGGGNPTSRSANPNGTTADGGSINIFPNPTKGDVSVTSSTANITRVDVVDVYGSIIKSFNFNNVSQATVSLKQYVPGTYIIKVNNSTSKVVSKVE